MLRTAFTLSLLVLSACGPGSAGSQPAGKWADADGKASLELKADGAFAMDTKKGQHITGTWKLEGERLSLTGQGGAGDVAGTFHGTLKDGRIQIQFGPSTLVLKKS